MKEKKFKKYAAWGMMLAAAVLITSCADISSYSAAGYAGSSATPAETENTDKNTDSSPENRDVINQVSLLQGLTFGDYNGSIPVSRLKELGDTGIGTFHALNGELIMLKGTVYRAASDGSIRGRHGYQGRPDLLKRR